MHPASPLVASLGGLNAVSLIPLPFLASGMQQSLGNGVPHLRNGHLALPAPCHWHRFRTYAPSKPTGCFPGCLNAVSLIPLPFLASGMQSPGNGMQPLPHLRNGPVGVALPVVQAVGAALGGACVVQWCVSSTEHPRFLGRWAASPETRTGHKTRPTNHAQTREIRLQPDPRRQQRHTMHSPS